MKQITVYLDGLQATAVFRGSDVYAEVTAEGALKIVDRNPMTLRTSLRSWFQPGSWNWFDIQPIGQEEE